MRVTLREAALLALPTLSNAVSLSDMTPRASNLPPQCQAVYTSPINGCTPQDFQTFQCSPSCISALDGVAQAVQHACVGQTGQNIVVAFLAGVGPQQLCHNVGSNTQNPGPPTSPTQPPPQQTHWSPTIASSTTTAQKPTETTSLLVDTSSTMTATIIPDRPRPTTSTSSAKPVQSTTTNTSTPEQTNPTQSPAAATTTSSGSSNPQPNFNDGSGGGSPFDTAGNTGGAPSLPLSLSSIILPAAAAMLVALR